MGRTPRDAPGGKLKASPRDFAEALEDQAIHRASLSVSTTERPEPIGPSDRFATRISLLIIAGVTVWAYWRAVGNGFVDWDDEPLLVHNERFCGLSPAHLRWMFTTSLGGHYQPLTWLSYAVESRLWGVNPAGFHFTNLVLHSLTAIVFFMVSRQILRSAILREKSGAPDMGGIHQGTTIGALFAALLFSVHPLRVESVAWATERRDVLSALWLMLAVHFYIKSAVAGGNRTRWFLPSLLCYVISLLSKASGMTLPFVLLLLDMYPVRRIGPWRNATEGSTRRVVFAEKLLFLPPAMAASMTALWAQREAGALWDLPSHPFSLRVAQAFYGLAFYPLKTLWPVNLVPLYEQRPDAHPFDGLFNLSAILVFASGFTVWRLRRRWPGLCVAAALYAIFLAPMLGFAQSGQQLVADRYTYLSCMPWVVLAGWVVAFAWIHRLQRTLQFRAVAVAGFSVVVTLTVLTRDQVAIWKDSLTLWTVTVARAPDTPTAHVHLAILFNRAGDFVKAREHAVTAFARLPGNRAAHMALARASSELGDWETAERHSRIALAVARNLGKDVARSLADLASILSHLGQFAEVESLLREAVQMEPKSSQWRFDLAGLLASQNRFVEAESELLAASIHSADLEFRLGVIQLALDKPKHAVASFERGLTISPDNVDLLTQSAWVLSTSSDDSIRDGQKAQNLAQRAFRISGGKNVRATESLAAALAETGQYSKAAEAMEALLSLNQDSISDQVRNDIQSQLDMYRSNRPWRE